MKGKLIKYFSFDPLKNFFQLPILWWSVCSFVLLALVIAGVINYNSDLLPRFDYLGFNQAITIFKVPLGLLAFIIPVVALLAANHRSVQTKQQLRLTEQQNIFSNHFKHIEEFEKYISSHINNELFFINNRSAHRILFPTAGEGYLNISESLLDEVNSLLNMTVGLIKQFSGGHKKKPADTIIDIELSIRQVEKLVGLEVIETPTDKPFIHNGVTVMVRQISLKRYFKKIKQRIDMIKVIFEFDQNISLPQALLDISKMNVEVVPEMSMSSEMSTTSFAPLAF